MMTHFKWTWQGKSSELLSAILVIVGMCIFGIFIHAVTWWRLVSFIGLALVAVVISMSLFDLRSLLSVLGIIPFTKKVYGYFLAGIIFGILLGSLYNFLKADSLLPGTLTKFALVAPLIGITEELIFRGFIQTRAASAGAFASIIIAASGHTLYKFLVIRTVPAELDTYYPSLVILTFLAGLVFGKMRETSGSVFPPALAHAMFDILVYGGAILTPVWIWG